MKCSEYSGETVLSSLGVNIKNEGFYSVCYWPFVMGIHRYLALYEGSPLVPGGSRWIKQRACNAEIVSVRRRHHDVSLRNIKLKLIVA